LQNKIESVLLAEAQLLQMRTYTHAACTLAHAHGKRQILHTCSLKTFKMEQPKTEVKRVPASYH